MGPRRKPRTPRRRPSSPVPGPSRRSSRPGKRRKFLWLKEIKKLQRSTDLLLRKLPFSRVVREICGKFTRGVDLCWQAQALLALQESLHVGPSGATVSPVVSEELPGLSWF
ncbi:histone H3-like centromeric protein A isoform X2 [Cricetulus griseus]|uniref:histone H3-like centromeric protein A isoform X2 n=1 Tax=Cricetulus griseus TaxID=10029 RepID=UPI000F7403F7|nr:histone H3-like centromeric protein A isoform X2 [Cricetulus griseus]